MLYIIIGTQLKQGTELKYAGLLMTARPDTPP